MEGKALEMRDYSAPKGWRFLLLLASAWSVAMGLLTPATTFAQVTSVGIVEKAGLTTANYPMTLSLVFKQGDVPSNVTANLGGSNLTTQTDVKNRYADGSVKHALVSFSIPTVSAGQTHSIDIFNGGANANSGHLTKTQLLATDFNASVNFSNFTNSGANGSVTARQLLNSAATTDYWMKGDVASEFLIRDHATNVNSQLNVQYNVRKYAGWNGYRVDSIVENTRTDARGILKYDVDLQLGHSNPTSALNETGLKHNHDSRWHDVKWLGDKPPEVEVRYDVDYLASTGAIAQYDTSLTVPESKIASEYASWQASDHELIDSRNTTGVNTTKRGLINPYFGATGGRQEIGLQPTWNARYLLTMDNRMREIMLNQADIAGSIPIHLRESNPAKNAVGNPVTIDDRPTLFYREPHINNNPTATDDRLTDVGAVKNWDWGGCNATSACWSPDAAHQASFAYLPYLITGDQFYKEEMYFWASYDLIRTNPGYRGQTEGWLRDQSRGEAWMVRNISDAAFLAPDADSEQAYFAEKTNNILDQWVDEYLTNGNFPSAAYWARQSVASRADPLLDPNVTYYTSPWMDDFVLLVLDQMQDKGFDTEQLVDFLGESIVERFSNSDVNPYRGAPYHLPVEISDGNGGHTVLTTWQEINDAYVDNAGPTDFPNENKYPYEYTEGDYPYSYNFIARAALGQVLHLPGAQEAYDWLDSEIESKDRLNEDPTWAFIAPTFGDFDADGDIDGDDIDALGAASPTDLTFDLDGNGMVTVSASGSGVSSDLDYLIRTILGTEYGDANLDGEVDIVDFDLLGQGFQGLGAGWLYGDFSGSGGPADIVDFDLLGQFFGFSRANAASQAIPEPTAVCLSCFVLIIITVQRQPRK